MMFPPELEKGSPMCSMWADGKRLLINNGFLGN